jgi:hypothetical protein
MMRKAVLILAGIFAAAYVASATVDSPAFVGAGKCKDCHKTEKQGKQYPIWEASLHAQAFNNLKTDAAKTTAAAAGIAGSPEQAAACLKCHAPLAEKAPDLAAEGVSCEACHGPGSLYRKLNIMMNRDASVQNGLILYATQDAVKAQCLTCHANAHGKVLDFAAGWEKIKHTRPAK